MEPGNETEIDVLHCKGQWLSSIVLSTYQADRKFNAKEIVLSQQHLGGLYCYLTTYREAWESDVLSSDWE